MLGAMMQRPLLISHVLDYAAEIHKNQGIVSATVEGGLHRYSYAEASTRAKKLAQALTALGVKTGDRVATLAWNGYRHFELYYGIAGMGAVCHTLNPRLSPEQMLYIIAHAEDSLLFLDLTFVPLVEKLQDKLPKGLRYVVMTDRQHMPDTSLPRALCYEDLLAEQDGDYAWPDLDENTASGLCYTSGTTGNPKGALYSHRSSVLHALFGIAAFQNSLRAGNRILPVVPLFHVNAWGSPYAAPLVGASLIMPGPGLDGPSLWRLMEDERVNSAWGVPTVWQGLLAEIQTRGRKPQALQELVIGGSAAALPMIEAYEALGINICHAWGMTEMSPIGTQGQLTGDLQDLPLDQQLALKATQGRRIFGVELKILDDNGKRLPHDGKAVGQLYTRGGAVISGYYNNAEASVQAFDDEGWFGTGDMAKIDGYGFMTIADRSKDLIKSGGEWISSIDLENALLGHPDVDTCAVIAIPHPKWDERPLAVVVPKGDARPSIEALCDFLSTKFARWQLPDAVEFVDSLPLTATGKVSKLTLRQRFADHPASKQSA